MCIFAFSFITVSFLFCLPLLFIRFIFMFSFSLPPSVFSPFFCGGEEEEGGVPLLPFAGSKIKHVYSPLFHFRFFQFSFIFSNSHIFSLFCCFSDFFVFSISLGVFFSVISFFHFSISLHFCFVHSRQWTFWGPSQRQTLKGHALGGCLRSAADGGNKQSAHARPSNDSTDTAQKMLPPSVHTLGVVRGRNLAAVGYSGFALADTPKPKPCNQSFLFISFFHFSISFHFRQVITGWAEAVWEGHPAMDALQAALRGEAQETLGMSH